MARVPYIETTNAGPEVREVYEGPLRGKPVSFHKLIAHRPEVLKTLVPFYGSVGKSLDRRTYELVYLRVSLINGCNYCSQHHIAGSKRAGVTPEESSKLNAGDYSAFSDKEQAALRLAEKLTVNPRGVGDAEVATLRKHFSDDQIVDLYLLVGLANLTNRFTDPLGADLEFAAEKLPGAVGVGAK